MYRTRNQNQNQNQNAATSCCPSVRHSFVRSFVVRACACLRASLPPCRAWLNHTKQVSVMARMKADDKAENGGVIPSLRKLMTGHLWRESLKVRRAGRQEAHVRLHQGPLYVRTSPMCSEHLCGLTLGVHIHVSPRGTNVSAARPSVSTPARCKCRRVT